MATRSCKNCGREFQTGKNRGRRYCSGECVCDHEAKEGRRRRAKWSPERRRASGLVWTAIWRGDLKPHPCEQCGAKRAQAHHDDYSKPLDVRWLCRSHHKRHHDADRRAAADRPLAEFLSKRRAARNAIFITAKAETP